MKTNLKKAVRFEVRQKDNERFIQLFDEHGNELDGSNAYWEGNFYCSYKELTTLKGCSKIVNGYFYCYYNQLTTLEGCPESVGGGFDCSYNKLTTLEGSPESVNGNFHCNNNQLTTLKGSPKSVGGNFGCNNNQLTTLKGCPESVGGGFNCSNNQLTTLKGCPKVVGRWFSCSNNQLNILKGCPENVGDSFDCSNNQLTTLEGCPKVIGDWFDCSYNQLTTLEGAPKLISGKFYADSKLDTSTIFSINTKTDKELFDRALELGYVLSDDILTKLISKKTVKGIEIYYTQNLNNEDKVFVVSVSTHFSHGETIKEALLDLDFKLSERNKNLYKKWNKDTEVSLNEMILAYRVITGACKHGINEFIKSNKLPSKVKVKDVIKLTKGHYGHEDFKEFFQA